MIDDLAKNDCIKKGIIPNKINLYSQTLNRIKQNTHIIMCMSPLGNMTSTRLRMFPSFTNNCSLDWFTEWPEEALVGVGKGNLADYEDEYEITE